MNDLTGELNEDEVFVFTPRGDLFEFPKGATVLDFAFRVHTDVGLHAKGGKINGKIVPIRTELNTGDQVEIIIDKNLKPSPLWLRFLKTGSARQKVRQYLRKVQEDLGKEFIASNKNNIVITDKDLGETKKPKADTEKKVKQKKKVSVIVGGFKDILVRMGNCCSPLPGDEILGFITRGRGVTVHRLDCEFAKKHGENKRLVNVRWDGVYKPVPVGIEVRAYDRPRIYLEIVESISKTDTNILEAGASSAGNGTLVAKFLIEIEHHDQLQEIMDNIKSIKNIIQVERVKTKA
jgi:GTP pyrophosphokinase